MTSNLRGGGDEYVKMCDGGVTGGGRGSNSAPYFDLTLFFLFLNLH